MFKSSGTLRYSPKLTGNARVSSKWWLVLDCDPVIGDYYRQLFTSGNWGIQKWTKPAWGAHISVIRNEEPSDKAKWEAYNGIEVEFEYGELTGNDLYLWLPVRCERLNDIREELGLVREPFYKLHLTVGNCKGR